MTPTGDRTNTSDIQVILRMVLLGHSFVIVAGGLLKDGYQVLGHIAPIKEIHYSL